MTRVDSRVIEAFSAMWTVARCADIWQSAPKEDCPDMARCVGDDVRLVWIDEPGQPLESCVGDAHQATRHQPWASAVLRYL